MSHTSDDPYAPPPENNAGGQQPQYGQNPPQYGQNPTQPQYGQNPPQYGQNPPQYGQSPTQPQYGQQPGYPAAPGYDQGQYPYGGYGQGQPAGPVGRPGTLLAASILTWIGSGLGILVGLVLMVASGSSEFRDQLDDVEPGAVAAIGGIILAVCVVSALMAFFAFKGHRWAVIVLTVLGALFMLGAISSLAQGNGGGIVSLAWIGAAVGLFWATPSRQFYARR
ncbi:hypothetical protein PZ938_16310 [Luteipulveratus sp. YIM 133132]|uniref:DUF4064 domain-containing protein n=1 Tax=Luteipulveratus flavus TaxID=3031728 RepID=UPI0023AF3A4F|nr:hypothetical protein [Luteipulveratus sp. YIM 133132]MDE9367183.1 hypothetical protein [Luteipulveratus sp. YIM 133132]